MVHEAPRAVEVCGAGTEARSEYHTSDEHQQQQVIYRGCCDTTYRLILFRNNISTCGIPLVFISLSTSKHTVKRRV